jgi:hypothetical protein
VQVEQVLEHLAGLAFTSLVGSVLLFAIGQHDAGAFCALITVVCSLMMLIVLAAI